MHSSTSSSDRTPEDLAQAVPGSGIDPVFLREIPSAAWPRAALAAVVLAAVATGGWEAFWRSEQYVASYRNSDGQWAETRRRIDAQEPNATALIGSSRMLFDISLDTWREETGAHPIQLALQGSNPLPVLTHLAEDEDFRGLLVVGITPPLVLMPGVGLRASALERYRTETPSERIGNLLSYPLDTIFAFYRTDTMPMVVLARQPWWPDRPGLPFQVPEVRDIEIMRRDRDTTLWERVENDPAFNAIVTGTWRAILENLPPPPPEDVARASFEALLAQVARDAAAIRARGGEVVFLRPPSSGFFREWEARAVPRERLWEPIIAAAGAVGVHFEDYPELQIPTPEWSHISGKDKERFTRAVIRILRERLAERGIHRPELGP
jgi:hypothetical protein